MIDLSCSEVLSFLDSLKDFIDVVLVLFAEVEVFLVVRIAKLEKLKHALLLVLVFELVGICLILDPDNVFSYIVAPLVLWLLGLLSHLIWNVLLVLVSVLVVLLLGTIWLVLLILPWLTLRIVLLEL